MKIYLVMGQTGEYDDYQDWPVKAYTNKLIAIRHMELANLEAEKYDYNELSWDERQNIKNKNPFDKNFKIDYTGTTYRIEEIELSEVKTEEEFNQEIFLETL